MTLMTPAARIVELEAEVSALRGTVAAQRTLLEGAQAEVKRVAGKLAAIEGFLATGECLGCNGTGVPNGMPYECEECELQSHHEEIEAGGAAGVSEPQGRRDDTPRLGDSGAPSASSTVRKRCAGCGDDVDVPAEQNDHARPCGQSEHTGMFQCGPLYAVSFYAVSFYPESLRGEGA